MTPWEILLVRDGITSNKKKKFDSINLMSCLPPEVVFQFLLFLPSSYDSSYLFLLHFFFSGSFCWVLDTVWALSTLAWWNSNCFFAEVAELVLWQVSELNKLTEGSE